MPFLIAKVSGYSPSVVNLTDGPYTIGRDPHQCDISHSLPTLSRMHARFSEEGGTHFVEDLESSNGVYVNGNRITQRTTLQAGDEISFGAEGAVHFIVHTEPPESGFATCLAAKSSWTIGRSEDSDIVLAGDPTISSRHAVLKKRKDSLVIEDANSLNGTWLNDKRVKKAVIKPQDALLIGRTLLHFSLLEDGKLEYLSNAWSKNVQLESIALSREVSGGKKILDGVNININPGEFVGILGPSGAGKSTLLKALNGYAPPTEGAVLLNEIPLYENYRLFRNSISYVPQDDIIHLDLSVGKTLNYIAGLRLPRDMDRFEREHLVDRVIDSLGINHVTNTPVKELSGGQRKRVSVAAELLTNPDVLFMDEPTSGLDPSTEEKLMLMLRNMSSQDGTTILVTTHILYNLDLFDKVIFVARGQLVFYGSPDQAMQYFTIAGKPVTKSTQIFEILEAEIEHCGTKFNDIDIVIGDKDRAANLFSEAFSKTCLYRENITEGNSNFARKLSQLRDKLSDSAPIAKDEQVIAKEVLTSPAKSRGKRVVLSSPLSLGHLITLTKRQFALRTSSWSRIAFNLLIPVLLGLLTLSINNFGYQDEAARTFSQKHIEQQIYYGGDRTETAIKALFSREASNDSRSASEIVYELQHETLANLPVSLSVIVILAMTAVFCGTFLSCLELSTERPIYIRERMTGLKVWDYLVSKLPYLLLMTLIQMSAYIGICMLDETVRHGNILHTWMALVLLAWVSVAFGMLISALDPSAGQLSVLMAIIIVLPQLVLSGVMAPDYFQGMSTIKQYISGLLPARWGTEMLINTTMSATSENGTQWIPSVITNQIGFRSSSEVLLRNTAVLIGQFFVVLVVTRFLLTRLDPIRQ